MSQADQFQGYLAAVTVHLSRARPRSGLRIPRGAHTKCLEWQAELVSMRSSLQSACGAHLMLAPRRSCRRQKPASMAAMACIWTLTIWSQLHIDGKLASYDLWLPGRFGCGFAYGAWNGVLASHGIPVTTVCSRRWKSDLQLNTKGKAGSRELALQLFPEAESLLKCVNVYVCALLACMIMWQAPDSFAHCLSASA